VYRSLAYISNLNPTGALRNSIRIIFVSLSLSHLATAHTTRSDIAKNGMYFGTMDLSFKVVECIWRLNKIRIDKLL